MTGPWVSGESLSPSRLNAHAGAATLLTGFSTDTLQGQSGLTVNVISDLSAQNVLAGQHLELGGAPSSASGLASIRAHSQQTDYLFFQDAAGIKSNFLLGLKTGDSNASNVDGLNLFDASDNTMIVRFSSDSVRFYPPIVAPVFDSGGALASTYNAALFLRGGSKESQVQAAITAAAADGVARVYVPASLYPYSAGSVSFDTRVQMVREGGSWDVWDVKAYGASGNTVTEDAAAWRGAEAGRAANLGTLYAPAGVYRISSVITSNTAYTHWRGEGGAIILCNVSSDACAKFVADTLAQGQYHTVRVENLRIRNNISAHRIPMITFGDAHALTGLNINDLELDANFLPRDGILLDRVFEGSLRVVNFENFQSNGTGLGVGCVYRATDLNSGNIHFDTWTSTTNPILFLLNDTPGEGNVINNVHFNNCKLGRGTFNNANKFFAGTVAGSQATSATTLALTAGQGASFTTGDWIIVEQAAGGKLWVDRVASKAGDTLTLTATGGLPFSLANLDVCVAGYWHTIAATNTRQLKFTVPHFERCNGIFVSGSQGGSVEQPILGPALLRGLYLNRTCQNWEMRQPTELTALSSSAIVMHQAGTGFTNRNRLVGPVKITSGATILQIDQGSTVNFVGRFGGNESLVGVWHQDTTVAASQTNVQLVGPNMSAARGLRMLGKGAPTAINLQTSVARSAGTLTATVFIRNTASTVSTSINASNVSSRRLELQLDGDIAAFNPGDLIDVRVTTSSDWAPAANDLDVSLYVSQ